MARRKKSSAQVSGQERATVHKEHAVMDPENTSIVVGVSLIAASEKTIHIVNQSCEGFFPRF